jgi:hypothetical protein
MVEWGHLPVGSSTHRHSGSYSSVRRVSDVLQATKAAAER